MDNIDPGDSLRRGEIYRSRRGATSGDMVAESPSGYPWAMALRTPDARTPAHDVIVVGCGIVGASCAWHLAAAGLRVLVLEREAGPALGSTGRSAAGVRVQFTSEANILLSLHSLPVWREFQDRHETDVGYRPIGYLLLVPEDDWDTHLQSVALQRSLGAPVEVLEPREALRYLPLSTAGLGGATFGPWDGVIDPHLATSAWVEMAREAGASFRFRSAVEGIERRSDLWVLQGDGFRHQAPMVVNATGAWAGQVGGLAGLKVPVVPKRVQIFLSAPIPDPRTYPLTIDTGSGVYLRSEGDRILFGLDDLDEPPGFSEGIDPGWLEHVLLTGVQRFPWWEELGVDRGGSWWGYYEVTPDHSPLIGPHPDHPTWIDACGFSGHGVMHAPATGLAVSELVTRGEARTVSVDAFSHRRFTGDPPRAAERNVF